MTKEGKVGVEAAIALVTISTIAKAFYISPTLAAQKVGTANWYVILIASILALIIYKAIFNLLAKYPGKSIMEVYQSVMGPYLGFVFNLLLFLSLLLIASVNVREFADVLMIFTLPESPPSFIIGMFVFAIILVSYIGFESIVRFASMFFYILMLGLIIVVLLSAQNFQIGRMFPILGYGIDVSLYNSVIRTTGFREIIIVAVFANSLQGKEHIRKAGYSGIIISAITISVLYLAVTLSFPYNVVQEMVSPMYEMASMIEYGRFFQRLESVFIFIWSLCSLVSVTAIFYSALTVYCNMFKIKDIKPVIIPMAITFFGISMIPQSITTIIEILVPFTINYTGIMIYIPALIALIFVTFTKSRRNKING